jgi:6-phosphogluconolactonase
VVVAADQQVLAAAIAARLITTLADAQAARGPGGRSGPVGRGGTASVVLTGGGIGTATLAAVAASPARDAVDWSNVDFWWGDERFLPAGDAERNETGARSVMLDQLPVELGKVHPMGASDGPDGDDVDAAAAQYAAGLPGGFDVLLLGIGPEGHVASLFPGRAELTDARAVVAVRDSPKPPPTRISLTYGPICSAREVWILASGAEKADAIAAVAAGTPAEECPASGAVGTERTLLLVDLPAASKL